jgi:phospholipase C
MVRTSPNWEESLLIITYDEHGGLYDHVHPPAAVPPGPVSQIHPSSSIATESACRQLVSPFIPRQAVVQTVFDSWLIKELELAQLRLGV